MLGKPQTGATATESSSPGTRPAFAVIDKRAAAFVVALEQCGMGSATFSFEQPAKRTAYARRVTPDQQRKFAADFTAEAQRLAAWARGADWPVAVPPDLQVAVSDRYAISRSLVPAWFGQRGSIEFPAWRVAAGRAAITHELVHVILPNANRLLAEGLAVHLQAELGRNPAFPNFGKSLHQVAYQVLRTVVPSFCADDPARCDIVDLAALDSIPVPNPLVLRIGETFCDASPHGQARVYPLAGSFVRYLIDVHGIERFRALYDATPLSPFVCNPGAPERWKEIFGYRLDELAIEWKRLLLRTFARSDGFG